MIRTKHLTPAALALLLALAACADERPIPGEITLNDAFVADFSLTDMHGQPATDERFEGKPMLIYFGFTNCPDVCPAALGVLSATLDSLGTDADAIAPLFITVDPERDTAERLRDHLAFDGRILGLTGSEADLEAARMKMRVFASKVPLPSSEMGYTVDHQSLFFMTDADGKPIVAFDDGTNPDAMAQRIRTLLSKHST